MKILNFVSSLDLNAGGPTQSIRNQLKYLSFCYPEQEYVLYTKSSRKQLEVNDFQKNIKIKFFSYNYQLLIEFFNEEFDLIHFHGIWDLSTNLLMVATRIRKIPYIISPRGMLEPWALKQGKLKKQLALKIYQKSNLKEASFLHATSEMEFNGIRYLNLQNKIEIIPNGIDLSEINIDKNLRKENTLLFISRIHTKKGIEILIEAFSNIDNNLYENWKVEIYGDGDSDYIKDLNKLVEAKSLQSKIKINKPIWGNEKFIKIQTSKYLVLPSFSENFGNVIAESLACGTPVITSKNTPWSDLVEFNCGWYVDNNINSFALALTSAISMSSDKYNELANNARKLVEEKYDSRLIVNNIHNLYSKLNFND
jgi:glycosyltransferase involved in cell wall biosynthesis